MAEPSADWLVFADPAFSFEFRYPRIAPSGGTLTVSEQERSDRRRVHISSGDAREVYFELEVCDRRTGDEALAELTMDVKDRYPDADFSAPQGSTLAGQPARSVRFTFAGRERLAVFSEMSAPSHRVILDPRSDVNFAILATLNARG